MSECTHVPTLLWSAWIFERNSFDIHPFSVTPLWRLTWKIPKETLVTNFHPAQCQLVITIITTTLTYFDILGHTPVPIPYIFFWTSHIAIGVLIDFFGFRWDPLIFSFWWTLIVTSPEIQTSSFHCITKFPDSYTTVVIVEKLFLQHKASFAVPRTHHKVCIRLARWPIQID